MAIDDKYITTNISAELKKRINETSRGGSRRAKILARVNSPDPSQNNSDNRKEASDQNQNSSRSASLDSNSDKSNPNTTIDPFIKTREISAKEVDKSPAINAHQTDINQISKNTSNVYQSGINQVSKNTSNVHQSDINHELNEYQTYINQISNSNNIIEDNKQKGLCQNHTSNVYQSDIKHTSETVFNGHQTDILRTSNAYQSDIKHTSFINQNVDQIIHQNIHQNVEKIDSNYKAYEATTLHGHQLTVFSFILKQCRENGAFFTKRLSLDFLKLNIEIGKPSIRLAIHRLKEKKLILSRESKEGRGGWTVYEIPHSVFKEVATIDNYFSQVSNTIHTSQHTSKYISEHISNPPSKLVSNLINTNLTKEPLIYDFNASDCDLSQSILIGVGEKAIGDALRNLTKKIKLYPDVFPVTKDEFQDFINKFVEYASSENGKGIKNIVAMFISEFEKFQLTGSCATVEWHNDKDFEQIEQYVKQQEAEKKRRQEFIEKALDFKFDEWANSMKKEDLLELVPESQFSKFGGPGYQMELKSYFRNNIWENVRKEIKA